MTEDDVVFFSLQPAIVGLLTRPVPSIVGDLLQACNDYYAIIITVSAVECYHSSVVALLYAMLLKATDAMWFPLPFHLVIADSLSGFIAVSDGAILSNSIQREPYLASALSSSGVV